MTVFETVRELINPRPINEFYQVNGLYHMNLPDCTIGVGTDHKASRTDKPTHTRDSDVVYYQSQINPLKLWCRSKAQDQQVKQMKSENARAETHRKKNYFAKKRATYDHKNLSEAEIAERLEEDWARHKWRHLPFHSNQINPILLWCEDFSLFQLRKRIDSVKKDRVKRGIFEALINHSETVSYYEEIEALGAGFYPSLKIKFRKGA
jgi:hypothetical protein